MTNDVTEIMGKLAKCSTAGEVGRMLDGIGYQIVPIEPTLEMKRAAVAEYLGEAPDPKCWKWGDDGERVDRVMNPYRAAIQAHKETP